MDRKSIIILAVCFALFALWSVLVPKYYAPRQVPPPPAQQPVSTATTSGTNLVAAPPVAATNLGGPASATAAFVRPEAPEELVVLTNENARYTFTSHGGGLKLVELVHYPESVAASRKKSLEGPRLASLNTQAPVPVLALLGDAALQGDGVFTLTQTEAGVRAEQVLTNGLTVVKEFQLSSNYLLSATVRLQNTGTQTLTLPAQAWVIGTATPMDPDDSGRFVGVLWYDGQKMQSVDQSYFSPHGFMCTPRIPPAEYRGGASNVVWAAVNNQFFALAAMPQEPAVQLTSIPVALPRAAAVEDHVRARNLPPPRGFQTTLDYPPATLAPQQTITNQFHFFAGPKEYRTLARIGNRFNNNLDLIMGFNRALGWGVTAFFAKALLVSMNGLHDLLKLGYGWVIIVITFIFKLAFWPLTQASTRSMKRMAALQPQMKALQEKYKDDPAKMNKKLMEFMKEHKVSPLGGCLPMLLQMPVFIGFYVMIQSAIELRGAQFLWVQDLSKPDTLFRILPGSLDIPFNLLPLLMGATMLWQSHMTPPSPGMDPTQQKMMRYMPLIFLFMLYNFSAGLTLYWTVQNLLTIAQMKLTRAQQGSTVLTAPVATAPPQKKRK